jgi:hypothetical protein
MENVNYCHKVLKYKPQGGDNGQLIYRYCTRKVDTTGELKKTILNVTSVLTTL